MFGLSTVTAPLVEPLSLEEVKLHLRVSHDFEDERIKALMVAAREHAETFTGRAFITQTLRLTLDAFPAGEIVLPKPPLQSVSSVTYYTTNSATVTLTNNTDYQYDIRTEPGRIEPITTWPVAYERIAAVTVQYVAGYGLAVAVPQQIKQAILLLVSGWYEPGAKDAYESAAKALLRSSWAGTMAGSYG